MTNVIIFELEILLNPELEIFNIEIIKNLKKLKKRNYLLGYISSSPFCYHDAINYRINQYAESIIWSDNNNRYGLIDLTISNIKLKKLNIKKIFYISNNENYINSLEPLYKNNIVNKNGELMRNIEAEVGLDTYKSGPKRYKLLVDEKRYYKHMDNIGKIEEKSAQQVAAWMNEQRKKTDALANNLGGGTRRKHRGRKAKKSRRRDTLAQSSGKKRSKVQHE
jgi:hypothetical protein